MKRVYFIRHGESELNVAGLFAGHSETPLTAKGREQASQAGKQATQVTIDHIISSPLSRAHETAQIVARTIGYPEDSIEVNSLLIERYFGSMEQQPYHPDFNMDGIADAESHDTLKNRATLFWEYVQSLPYDTILVVSHGSFGRMFRHVLHPEIPFASSSQGHHFPNAQLIQLFP
jgi:alpha-ribazole phosphatase